MRKREREKKGRKKDERKDREALLWPCSTGAKQDAEVPGHSSSLPWTPPASEQDQGDVSRSPKGILAFFQQTHGTTLYKDEKVALAMVILPPGPGSMREAK